MSVNLDSRTGLEYFTKQPSESRLYTFNFAPLLGVQTIDSFVSVVQVNQNLIANSVDLTLGTPILGSGTQLQVRLSAGTDKEDYKLTALVLDTGGNTLEGDGILKVRNL